MPARPRPIPIRGPIWNAAARFRWPSAKGCSSIARVDDDGRPLDARCVYEVGPRVPAARYWTLSLVDPDGWPIDNLAGRYGFRSSEILRAANGDFAITVARDAHSGQLAADRPVRPLRARPSALRFAAWRDRGRDRQVCGAARDEGRLRMRVRFAAGGVAVYVAATAILAALVHLHRRADRAAGRDARRLCPARTAWGAERDGPAAARRPERRAAALRRSRRGDELLPIRPRRGPIRVTAPSGRAFASISFHTRRGLVFYALTDKAATHGVIDIVLATPKDVQALAAHDDEEDPSRDLRVAAPAREGYVAMRVFSELPSLYAEAEAEAKRLTCKPEPAPHIGAAVDFRIGWRESARAGWERISRGRTEVGDHAAHHPPGMPGA